MDFHVRSRILRDIEGFLLEHAGKCRFRDFATSKFPLLSAEIYSYQDELDRAINYFLVSHLLGMRFPILMRFPSASLRSADENRHEQFEDRTTRPEQEYSGTTANHRAGTLFLEGEDAIKPGSFYNELHRQPRNRP